MAGHSLPSRFSADQCALLLMGLERERCLQTDSKAQFRFKLSSLLCDHCEVYVFCFCVRVICILCGNSHLLIITIAYFNWRHLEVNILFSGSHIKLVLLFLPSREAKITMELFYLLNAKEAERFTYPKPSFVADPSTTPPPALHRACPPMEPPARHNVLNHQNTSSSQSLSSYWDSGLKLRF